MTNPTHTRPVALVTGAGGGLGGAIARALAAKRFDLVLSDLADSAALADLNAAIESDGASGQVVLQDIADVAALPGFVDRVHAIYGRLDCLVNNAGVSVMSRGDILDVTPESFDRCVGVNLRAQFFLTQQVARRMLRDPRPNPAGGQRRSIVTISTVAVDHVVGKVLAEYSISKAALPHMVKHFAVRLVTEGIDCYEVRPGMMATSMTSSSREKYDGLIAAGFVPAHRWGELADIGNAVATLASGALSYSVGQTVHIDGGMRLKVF
jgi:NAD(P)-dependent dehydrogenase (short-subunit alcohol dehydrogenase family)